MKPKLIHPIKVKIHSIDKTTPINKAYDEPEDEMQYRSPVPLLGQISYKVRNAFSNYGLGNMPEASGYVLCYASDWDKLCGGIGDLIEIPGSTKCSIIEIRPAGHYKGQHYFYKLFFDKGRGNE